jgi:hypothetical protein
MNYYYIILTKEESLVYFVANKSHGLLLCHSEEGRISGLFRSQ